MNIDDTRQAFKRDGFEVVENVLDRSGLQELIENVDRYRTQVASTFPEGHDGAMYLDPARRDTLIRMVKMQEHDAYFREMPMGGPWMGLAQALLGEHVENISVVYFNKPSRRVHANHPSPPHQDNFYLQLDPPNMMSFWIPLEPVDAENGCLRFVAGSHRKGIRRHVISSVYGFSQGLADYGPDDWMNERRVALMPGHAVAHHCMTIHRADANESDTRSRVALVLIYQGKSARVDEAWRARHQENVRKQQAALGRKITV